MQKTKIMLVEDNAEYREVIKFALKRYDTIELCAQFGTAEIALRSFQDMAQRTVPDVVLLDLRLPGMDGLEALPHFRKTAPDAKVVILTQSDNEADVLRAISQGASGYLLKSCSMEEIADGIRTVMEGGASLDANVAKFILNTLQAWLPRNEIEVVLTERELDTLTLLSEGLVKKEIADRLNISVTTVATHVAHIYEKFEVQNAPAAIAKAFKLGILPT
ncbi:Oxygen regulatory protein NreC [Pontiella desulfatans]|uniref:Oxygen regulatory protein NreC n=1 Tax=Pontiella desulfatans TaxID=2750659 RepID=A0A6C2U2R3_PONDE|nr:response regulator transcription factor [Pontiella desulfatans]VGO13861.1 Oxygen regulatory protein NreC [Pontiella desulfatans]